MIERIKKSWALLQNQYPQLETLKPWALPGFLGLLGAVLLFGGIDRYKEKLGYKLAVRQVLIAANSLSEGHMMAQADFEIKNVPKDFVPLGVLIASDLSQAVGMPVTRPIGRGSLIQWKDLGINFEPAVPARRIARNYRALAITVNEPSSAGQSIRPGDHVDIVNTTRIPGDEGPTSMMLLQNVTILSVGAQTGQKEDENYSTVTLMVLPKEVGLISLASQQGKLTLALRNPEDSDTPKDLPLIGVPQMIESAFRNSIQTERNHSIEVIRGGKVSLEQSLP